MAWRLARSLATLQAQVNHLYPNRPRQSDGTIGDARHQAEPSDHNPNAQGVVTAWDITTAAFTIDLAETLRQMGAHGDGRVKYVIYRGRIASPVGGWAWRPYVGFSQHYDHVHVSVSGDPRQYDRTDPWPIRKAGPVAKAKAAVKAAVAKVRPYRYTALPLAPGSHGPDVRHVQQRLRIPADGAFGINTELAVRQFQGAHRLHIDGVVGQQTAKALR